MTNENETTLPKRPRGRPKGSLGRRHQLAKDLIERLGIDPLEFLLRQVKNTKLALEFRIDCAKAAVPFCHPKLTTAFIHSRSEKVDVSRTVMESVWLDPELTAALEKLSFMESAAMQKVNGRALSEPSHIIDVKPEPVIEVIPMDAPAPDDAPGDDRRTTDG